MKKTFYLIVLFLLLFSTASTETDINNFCTISYNNFQYFPNDTNGNQWKYNSSNATELEYQMNIRKNRNLFISIRDHSFWSEDKFEQTPLSEKKSYLSNYLNGTVIYKKGNNTFKLGYANHYYNSDNTNYGIQLFFPKNIAGSSYPIPFNIKPNFKQNLIFGIKSQFSNLTIDFNSRLRRQSYEMFSTVPLFADTTRSHDSEVYVNGIISYKINSAVSAFSRIYHKNQFDFKNYNQTRYGLGFSFTKDLSRTDFLDTSVEYFYNDGKNIPTDSTFFYDNFIIDAEYSRFFSPRLTGFLHIINRSCYDRDVPEIYIVSTLMRMRVKYSLRENISDQAYVVSAIKYNPENNGTTYSAEINYPIWKNIYCNFCENYAPEIKNNISAGLIYEIGTHKNIYLKNSFTEIFLDNFDNDQFNLFSAGFQYLF